mgnify:CR=1 FL=1
MNPMFGKEAFDQVQKLFAPTNVQDLATKSVATSKEFFDKASAATQENARALAEFGETAIASTKVLQGKVAQNLSANLEAVFSAAEVAAGAKTLPEIGKVQAEFFQKMAATAMAQQKELADLSVRATQHLVEQAQATASKVFKPTV